MATSTTMNENYRRREEWLGAVRDEREFVAMASALKLLAQDLGQEPAPILAQFAKDGLKAALESVANATGEAVDAKFLRCRAQISRGRTAD